MRRLLFGRRHVLAEGGFQIDGRESEMVEVPSSSVGRSAAVQGSPDETAQCWRVD